jgi:hypothetical protein
MIDDEIALCIRLQLNLATSKEVLLGDLELFGHFQAYIWTNV